VCELCASTWDQNAGIFALSPLVSIVERITGAWLRDLAGAYRSQVATPPFVQALEVGLGPSKILHHLPYGTWTSIPKHVHKSQLKRGNSFAVLLRPALDHLEVSSATQLI
jgi:hypothetical protein